MAIKQLLLQVHPARACFNTCGVGGGHRQAGSDLGSLRQLAKDSFGGGAAKEEPVQAAEAPKAEEPKAEEPKAEEPKAEEPKAEEPKAEEPKAAEPKAEEPVAPPAEPEPSQAAAVDPPPEKKKKKKKSSVKSGKNVGDKVTVEGFEGEGTIRYKGKWQHGKNEGKNAIGVEMDDKVCVRAAGHPGPGTTGVFMTRLEGVL